MSDDEHQDGPVVEQFRDYLLMLARMQLGPASRNKVEASDVVQQTLLEAHRKRDQFRGSCEAEMAGWLRQLLAFNLADAARAAGRVEARRGPRAIPGGRPRRVVGAARGHAGRRPEHAQPGGGPARGRRAAGAGPGAATRAPAPGLDPTALPGLLARRDQPGTGPNPRRRGRSAQARAAPVARPTGRAGVTDGAGAERTRQARR